MAIYTATVEIRNEFEFTDEDILPDEDPEEAAFRMHNDFEIDLLTPEVWVDITDWGDDE